MASDPLLKIAIKTTVGGFNDGMSGDIDPSGVGKQRFVDPSQSGITNPAIDMPLLPKMAPFNHYHQYPDISSSILAFVGETGDKNAIAIGGVISDNPQLGGMPGVTSTFNNRLTGGGATTAYTDCYPNIPGFLPPEPSTKDGVPIQMNNQQRCHAPINNIMQQKVYGEGPDERNVKWEQRNAIRSPDSPFGSIPSLGMLQGLAGQIMSLASAFSGLSKQQKQRIKSNTSNQMYSLIETTLLTSTDVGNYQTVSLSNRVDKDTFANNMVDLLSQCQTYDDLRLCMHELRSNTKLHGKDKLPTVEYRVPGGFGETGLIIDGYGNYTYNVSPEVANAYTKFAEFITQDINDVTITCKFEGTITANTLDVNRIFFGQLESGNTCFIEGYDVTDNTYITSFGTNANGNTGIYNLNFSSNTIANNEMVMYKIVNTAEEKKKKQGGGGGGGLGGFTGMNLSMNLFGEASVLLGEMMPAHDPLASTKIQTVIGKIQSQQVLKISSWQKVLGRLWAGLPFV